MDYKMRQSGLQSATYIAKCHGMTKFDDTRNYMENI